MAPHLEVRRPSPTTVEFTVTTQPRRTGWTGCAIVVLGLAVRLLLTATAAVLLGLWVPLCVPEPRRRDWQILSPALHARLAAALVGLLDAASVPAPAQLLLLPLAAAFAAYASVARVHTAESLLVLRGLGIQTRSTGPTYVGELASALALAWWTLTSPCALLRAWSSPPSARAAWYGSLRSQSAAAATTTRFIPTEQLQDLLVNEAFRGFEVRYYLVAVVLGSAGERADADGHTGGSMGSIHEGDGGSGSGHAHDGNDSIHHHSYLADNDEEDHIVVVFPRLLPGLEIVQQVWREARACLYEPSEKS